MSWIEHIIKVLDPTGLLPIGITPNNKGEPDYSLLVWESENVPKPTEEEFAEAITQAQAMTYKTERRNAYPTIAEQLDLIFHGGIEQWRAEVQSVKDMYPKP